MLDFIYAILVITALIIMLVASSADSEFWATFYMTIDIVIFWFLAANSFEIEQTYTLFNATSGAVESGINIYTSKVSVPIFWLFLGLGAICLVISLYMVGTMIKTALNPVVQKKKPEENQGENIPLEEG
jgi:hypothetical protein